MRKNKLDGSSFSTTLSKLDVSAYKHIKTQSDAVLHFLQNLDIEIIDAVLEANRTYQDMEKSLFISKLGLAFNEFVQAGDTYLNRFRGLCNSKICNYKCSGFRFVGNHSRNFFDLIIDIKDGVVYDIYECSIFKVKDEEMPLRKRVEIDKVDDLFDIDQDDLPF